MIDILTDGTISGWPCNTHICGHRGQGVDLQTAPYTTDDGSSAPHEIALLIDACDGSFKTPAEAKSFAVKAGFVPDRTWGEME